VRQAWECRGTPPAGHYGPWKLLALWRSTAGLGALQLSLCYRRRKPPRTGANIFGKEDALDPDRRTPVPTAALRLLGLHGGTLDTSARICAGTFSASSTLRRSPSTKHPAGWESRQPPRAMWPPACPKPAPCLASRPGLRPAIALKFGGWARRGRSWRVKIVAVLPEDLAAVVVEAPPRRRNGCKWHSLPTPPLPSTRQTRDSATARTFAETGANAKADKSVR
jgi:hypothetical protein